MRLFRLLLASTLVCGSVLAFYVMARASGVQASVSSRGAAPAQANSGFSNLVQQRKTHAQVANDAGYTNFAYGPGELAARADAFVDATGFVTHVQYNDAGNYYPHLIPLIKLLQAAGIRHIRDGWANDWDMSHYETQGYSQMCAAGIKLTLLLANKPTRLGLDHFQGYVNGCVEAWEGYNECDAGPPGTCTMAVTWLAAQRQSANDLGILSLGLSGASGNVYSQSGDISQYIDAQNLHSYRDNNQNPEDTGGTNLATPFGYGYASLQWWMHLSRGNAIGLPFEVTEVGYKSSPSVLSGEVPESVQAAYLVRTLLVNFAAGVKRTFLYELFDEPGGDWGVVHNDLTPKPAYTYIKNLLLLLSDPGTTFPPGRLNYAVTGADPTLRHVLFQKRDGSFWLAFWLGQNSWNNNAPARIPVTPQNVSLVLSEGHTAMSLNVFANTGAVTTTPVSGSTLLLLVSDQVTLLQII